MIIYAYVAVVVAGMIGYRVFNAIGGYLVGRIFCIYFSLSPTRFKAIYSEAEESYDYLKAIFNIKIEHYKYIDAMQVFEETARDKFNSLIREDIKFLSKYFLQIFPMIAISAIFFLPVWTYYAAGLFFGFTLPSIYNLARLTRKGGYKVIVSMNIAEQADLYRCHKKID